MTDVQKEPSRRIIWDREFTMEAWADLMNAKPITVLAGKTQGARDGFHFGWVDSNFRFHALMSTPSRLHAYGAFSDHINSWIART